MFSGTCGLQQQSKQQQKKQRASFHKAVLVCDMTSNQLLEGDGWQERLAEVRENEMYIFCLWFAYVYLYVCLCLCVVVI